ncbi:UDP-glucose 4-epimerase GalE [Candidatus Venteria ishoeyi]|uniref:UDP-glucose 4-epimerase n=1 Tax=Candidatus Venteria ishoeyi TaxID=1899563 RepID=A0A1H6FHD2_9GAMM|nr:UDP-glucose 4-epimerase GalE [Candidatus Venteria ishoeyi]MDM8546814.1 UDP-glucose 4-epimerase GalE [Candidatus Venteria ishoeyi]SEH08404.1 UDP-glucose 4-epimerase [Candidatus Venteria ishoeyi]
MQEILVVGGAGYIGSHMVKMLLAAGYAVVTLDNLCGGYRDAVLGGEFVQADLADRAALEMLFQQHDFAGVMHFASFIQVGESVSHPGKYYQNNLANTLNLLDVMLAHEVKSFIFSSTAAIFGEPQYVPVDEKHPKQAINPYGLSKWMVEQVLADYEKAYQLKSICLRYFNAAGADPDGELGERHVPETHLIPLVLQAASGRRSHINVYGNDYDTPDGTCIRDYIHVTDLCQAHLLALQQLLSGQPGGAYNLGNGSGFSVQEVIDAARIVTGNNIPVVIEQRRSGDPARLVANAKASQQRFGWNPQYHQLETMLTHAWQWEQSFFAE